MIKYEIIRTNKFKKQYENIKKQKFFKEKDFTDVVNILVKGEQYQKNIKIILWNLRASGFYECHIKPDWLLIYRIDKNVLILTLIETGTHSELF